jgi:hypothetical protein
MGRIKVNVEKEVVRLSIPSDNGTIVINEPSQNLKDKLVKELGLKVTKQEDINEKEIMLLLIEKCTNVEFDGDIFEAKNLSHEAQMIVNEILIIFEEIIALVHQVLRLTLQQAKNEMLQNKIIEEKDEMIEQVEEKVEEKKTIEEMPRKVAKKPQRSRGKMIRK